MPNDRGVLREVAWLDLCPWLILVRTFRLAINPRVLVLATLGMVATTAGWRLVGGMFSGSEDTQLNGWIQSQSAWPWASQQIDVTPAASTRTYLVREVPLVGSSLEQGPVVAVWLKLSYAYRAMFRGTMSFRALMYFLIGGLWTLLVWSLFGGAITRITALRLTREDSLSLTDALAYARKNLGAYFFAPLLPLFCVALVMLPLALLGVMMRLDLGVLLGGLLWPLVLVAGLFLAIVVVGLFFGWPLIWATNSVERPDAFDPVSRAYDYVLHRPLHGLFYVAVVSLLGILGVLVVNVFAALVLDLGTLGVAWGTGGDVDGHVWRFNPLVNHADLPTTPIIEPIPTARDEPGWPVRWGTALIGFWTRVVFALQVGFQYAFFWVSATAIYLLFRRVSDGQEMDEIYLEDAAPPGGVPVLEEDAAGVAGVREEG